MEIKECKNHIDKFKGLMFKKNINYIFKIRCNGIHTFFMFEPINIILTDKNNIIIKAYYNVKPFKIILPKKNVYYTYELPYNYKPNIEIGKKITL